MAGCASDLATDPWSLLGSSCLQRRVVKKSEGRNTAEAPGRGCKGGTVAPAMFSRTTFLILQFPAKSCDGGDTADDLGSSNVNVYSFLQPCHFNCISPRSVRH